MCGIFTLLNYENDYMTNDHTQKIVNNEFKKGKNRGPEFSNLNFSFLKLILGFHRLAINGLNDISNQPIIINNIILICNGEIYNYKELYQQINISPITGSDCEVIIYLYLKYGIEQTLLLLDGEFSFILYDNRITSNLNNNVFVARDPYGVRPLYKLKPIKHNITKNIFGFASELKCLEYFYNKELNYYQIEQFTPGTYSTFNISNKVNSEWEIIKENIPFIIPSFSHTIILNNELNKQISHFFLDNIYDNHNIYTNISKYLNSAVYKRCFTCERPIACLLSGGLDSSLVTALVNHFYKLENIKIPLETYSIGLQNSEDLIYAKKVADYLGTKHTEIIITEEEMFEVIPEVIYAIESYDTTTVRASIFNYLLGKYISKNSEAKVILNGDGSDELFGGYLYMNKCPDDFEFDKEIRRLLKDIHLFDVLRSDKSISSNGLEPRTPFLDKSLVDFVLSISPYFRNHNNFNLCEKNILRSSYKLDNFKDFSGKQILPDEILWRKKEAFSDGVSSGFSLYQQLQLKIVNKLQDINNSENYPINIDTEKMYYKQIFLKYFPNCQNILPYLWMPKYTDATDPSARTLSFYLDTPCIDNTNIDKFNKQIK